MLQNRSHLYCKGTKKNGDKQHLYALQGLQMVFIWSNRINCVTLHTKKRHLKAKSLRQPYG